MMTARKSFARAGAFARGTARGRAGAGGGLHRQNGSR